MSKILMIVNPVSGKKKIRPLLLDILNRFEADGNVVTVSVTQRRGYATETVMAHAAEYDRIVCCGGDGTLNEVIRGLMAIGSEIPVGYIPSGSTNDFANCVGLPVTPIKAAEAIIRGEVYPLDIGRFNDAYFSYIASFGAFSSTSYSVSQTSKNTWGHLAYVFGGIADLKNITAIHAVCQTADATYEDDYAFGGVVNSTSIGGLVKLNKALVDMNDGQFEVILVKMPKNIIELNKIAVALTQSNFDSPLFEFFKTSEVRFTFENEIPWSLDGEYKNGGTSVSIANIHSGLRLLH